ncbi:hypothetical protein CFE70_003917 [Pyrenophora teres f. teres 0-1]
MHSTIVILLAGFAALAAAVEPPPPPRGHACQIKYDYCNVEPGTRRENSCLWNCGPKDHRENHSGVCFFNGKAEQEGGAPLRYCSWDETTHLH